MTTPKARDAPIFWGHGRDDQIVGFERKSAVGAELMLDRR
jgi:hypothetical protein